MLKWTMLKILKMAENITERKEYVYNKMPCINSKPCLQRGNENLLEYEISLPLHHQFCNPRKVIETVEECAKNGDIIDWVYQKKYMGQFVVTYFENSLTRVLRGTIIYAEIKFTLLEVPLDSEFNEQGEEDSLDEIEQYSENSSKLQEFRQTVQASLVENVKENILTACVSTSLSDTAKELVTSVANGVISDLSGVNITDIYNTAQNYMTSITNSGILNANDAEEAVKTIAAIPNLLVEGALR